jgi:hypothetical protein
MHTTHIDHADFRNEMSAGLVFETIVAATRLEVSGEDLAKSGPLQDWFLSSNGLERSVLLVLPTRPWLDRTIKNDRFGPFPTGILSVVSKTFLLKELTILRLLMKKLLSPLLVKAGSAGFLCLALSGIAPLAQAGPQTPHFSKADHDQRLNHNYHFYFFPSWWYVGAGPISGPGYDSEYWYNVAVKVQTALAQLGFYHGPINGIMDSGSRHAIRRFQRTSGLVETGLVDPALLKALRLTV